MTDRHLRITFTGWKADLVAGSYLGALQTLVSTARHRSTKPRAVTSQLHLARNAEHLATILARDTDVLVYAGHAWTDETEPPFFGSYPGLLPLAALGAGKGISASGIVLDCCQGRDPRFQNAIAHALAGPSAVLSCLGRSPNSHGPALLPSVLSQLAGPANPPRSDPETLLSVMNRALEAAARAWPVAHWPRWSARILSNG